MSLQIQEQKGLDMVRRDWCPLSKDVGNFALREILSAKPKEDVVTAIHEHLHKVFSTHGDLQESSHSRGDQFLTLQPVMEASKTISTSSSVPESVPEAW